MKTKKTGLKILAISLAIVFSVLGSSMVAAEEYVEPDIETPTTEEMREDALNRLEDATEEIEDVRADAEELKITVPAVEEVLDALILAERRLAQAQAAFAEGNYGLSFIYASKAEALAENTDALLDEIEEAYEKDWEIEVEIEYRRAYVEIELDELEMEFVLDTPNKEEIIREIMERTGLCQSIVRMITTFEFDDEVIEKIEELACDLQEALTEVGETYLEILEEIREAELYIDEGLKELMTIKMYLGMLAIPEISQAFIINKLSYVAASMEEVRVSLREGRVTEAEGLVSEVILHLNAFSAEIEIQRVRMDEDDAETLLEKVEELREDTEEWKWEIRDLIEELECGLIELDEAMTEVQGLVSELEALGAGLGVTIHQEENLKTSALITTTITVGEVTLKEASSCVTALMLEKPLIAALVGSFKVEILKHFEIDLTLDKRVSMLIIPHTPGKLVLVEAEELLARIISERMRGGATPCTISQFIALVTVERDVFRIVDVHLPGAGLVLIYLEYIVASQKLTHEPGMDTWRWWDGDFGWTHEIVPPEALPGALVVVAAPRLSIRALDVDWGVGFRWEHNRVYADGVYIGTMTGTPPRRWNRAWSVSKFDIPPDLIEEDGRVDIHVNIDSRHTWRTWVVNIDWSLLELEFTTATIQKGEVHNIPEGVVEQLQEWLRQENIGRENVGEPIPIVAFRTVRGIKDGDGFFVTEPIVRGRIRYDEVRMKGLDTPEVRGAMDWVRWPGRTCENQYHHAAPAKSALQHLIPRDTIVRIESYYPFGIDGLLRIEGFVFRDRVNIAEVMIGGGFGVAAILCAAGESHWYHEILGDRRLELLRAMHAARTATPRPRGIWNPDDLLVLHPYYYRWWTWSPAFTWADALRRSNRKLFRCVTWRPEEN